MRGAKVALVFATGTAFLCFAARASPIDNHEEGARKSHSNVAGAEDSAVAAGAWPGKAYRGRTNIEPTLSNAERLKRSVSDLAARRSVVLGAQTDGP